MSGGDDQARELLEQARVIVAGALELCRQRSGWTQRVLARDRFSHPVSVESSRAVRFCLFGALIRAARGIGLEVPPFAVESAPWTAGGVVAELPAGLELAVRVCGVYFARLFVAGGATVEAQNGELRLVMRRDETVGPLPWQVFVSSCNDELPHRHILAALRHAEERLARRLAEGEA